MSDRTTAMNALRQLEPHSPAWVKIIRDYIVHLECELGINPERNREIADMAGDPMTPIEASANVAPQSIVTVPNDDQQRARLAATLHSVMTASKRCVTCGTRRPADKYKCPNCGTIKATQS